MALAKEKKTEFLHVSMSKKQMKKIDNAVKKSDFSCKSEWVRVNLLQLAENK